MRSSKFRDSTALLGFPVIRLVSAVIVAITLLVFFAAASADAASPKLPIDPPNTSLRNEVKRAIDKGAAWLERNQDTNGFWSTADHPAVSALALVALQGPPGNRSQEANSPALRKGYEYLLGCAQPDGGIYRKELASYNTSVSVMALVVANRPDWQPAIVKARKFLISLQASFIEPGHTNSAFDGGIGYGKGDKRPDLSNTSLALVRSRRELLGRLALTGYSSVRSGKIDLTARAMLRERNPSTIETAKPCQLVSPAVAIFTTPSASAKRRRRSDKSLPMRRSTAFAMTCAEVGAPTWSATILSSSRSRAKRAIVLRKLLPRAAYTHDVRTIKCGPAALRIASSPASLLLPYIESGPVGPSSRKR